MIVTTLTITICCLASASAVLAWFHAGHVVTQHQADQLALRQQTTEQIAARQQYSQLCNVLNDLMERCLEYQVRVYGLKTRLDQAAIEQARLKHERGQLEAELTAIRQKRHTHQTTECFEDMESVAFDLDHELDQSFTYLKARLGNLASIIRHGRPGPYSYTPATTKNRPARPGTGVKTWP